MPYELVKNAKCLTKGLRIKATNCSYGLGQASVIIDELGRLFTCGYNYSGECGLGDWHLYGDDFKDIPTFTRVGIQCNWVKATQGEYSAIIMNSKGELWGFGKPESGSAFGLDENVMPNNIFYTPIRCAPEYTFKDFYHDYYHTIIIGNDDYLYTFGKNISDALGLGIYASIDELIKNPTKNPYLTDKIKFLGCEFLLNGCVTVDDKVYVWGSWGWGFSPSLDYDRPTRVEGLIIPDGETIVDFGVSYSGVVVLLSNGTVWAMGEETYCQNGSDGDLTTFHQITTLGDKFITKIKTNQFECVFCLDDEGNIWSWGWGSYQFGFSNCDDAFWIPTITGCEAVGERKFIDFEINTYHYCYLAIDTDGYVWSWGYQGWGANLGLGLRYEDLSYSCAPQRCIEFVDSSGNGLDVNILFEGTSPYTQPDLQLAAHEPCGHWHVRRWDKEELFQLPINCWMPSLCVQDGEIIYAVAGKYPDYGDTSKGFDLVLTVYDISHNKWAVLFSSTNVYYAENKGAVAKASGQNIYGYYNNHALINRDNPLQPAWSNVGMGILICYLDVEEYTSNYYYFPGSRYESGHNRMAINSSGNIAVMYTEDSTGDAVVMISSDLGMSFIEVNRYAYQSYLTDFGVLFDWNDKLITVHIKSNGYVQFNVSSDLGNSWEIPTDKNTSGIVNLKFFISSIENKYFLAISGTYDRVFRGSLLNDLYAVTLDGGTTVVAGSEYNNFIVLDETGKFNFYHTNDYNNTGYVKPQITLEGVKLSVDKGTLDEDMGYFAYTANNQYLYNDKGQAISTSILISTDNGEHWNVMSTPFRHWIDNVAIGCDPLFKAPTNWPNVFTKDKWNSNFQKQHDKF